MLQEGSGPLPRCNMCIIHMLAARLIKHHRTEHCFKNTEMMLMRDDVEVASRFSDMEFNLTGNEVEDTIEGVALFTYLGRLLDQSDNDWPAVRINFGKARQLWGRIGGIFRW